MSRRFYYFLSYTAVFLDFLPFASVALVVTVLATTLLGDAWRDRLAGERSVPARP